jgi:hypothetical protein
VAIFEYTIVVIIIGLMLYIHEKGISSETHMVLPTYTLSITRVSTNEKFSTTIYADDLLEIPPHLSLKDIHIRNYHEFTRLNNTHAITRLLLRTDCPQWVYDATVFELSWSFTRDENVQYIQ